MTATDLKLDYFKFYDVENRDVTADITLRGHFDQRPLKVQVRLLDFFGNPVSKNREPMYDKNAHPGYAHVSAVLYTPSCWVCHPHTPGQEFVVVHNPHARVPLPDGWLPAGNEYWLRDGEVQNESHSPIP